MCRGVWITLFAEAMPFVSEAQRRFCWAAYNRAIQAGKEPTWNCHRTAQETPPRKPLPYYVDDKRVGSRSISNTRLKSSSRSRSKSRASKSATSSKSKFGARKSRNQSSRLRSRISAKTSSRTPSRTSIKSSSLQNRRSTKSRR